MPRKPKRAMKASATDQTQRVELTAVKLATLKDLRKAADRTQEELAVALDVGQGTISKLEKRSDMLLSTLRLYIEGVGGKLQMVVTFPDRPPMILDRLGKKSDLQHKGVHPGAAEESGRALA